jgi:hypothetical protein
LLEEGQALVGDFVHAKVEVSVLRPDETISIGRGQHFLEQ